MICYANTSAAALASVGTVTQGRNAVANSITLPTRLETRTKESNIHASLKVTNLWA